MTDRPRADDADRRRIHTSLDTNLLVEAGAGSGKTTELLGRLVGLIREDVAQVGEVAAVTFTRKAAAELRERFQARLEAELVLALSPEDPEAAKLAKEAGKPEDESAASTPEEIERLERALRDIDRGFIGTIHSFCAKLLRERPLDAGLDPTFREIFGPEEERLRGESWSRYIERLTTSSDPMLDELRALNIEFFRLRAAYNSIVDYPDVEFPVEELDPPSPGDLRAELDAMLQEGLAIMPAREPEKGWDDLQKQLRKLERSHWGDGWLHDAVFFDALEVVVDHGQRRILNRWDPHREKARALCDKLAEWSGPGTPAARALRRWQAYRYGFALRFVLRAAEGYEADRRRAGLVTFNDLLVRTAELLCGSPSARRDLAGRFPYLLVDEFQDTDPIQAEIIFLLTSTDPDKDDWQAAEPRPGSLFVVGDPKQSIYRFRRADIAIYNQVRARLEADGEVVELTTNFRSQPPIEEFVNGVFVEVFPEHATEHQAAYAPLNADKDDDVPRGVFWYEVPSTRYGADAVASVDAPMVASWIASRVESGEREPQDFMVLAYRKNWLSNYAAELERRNVPIQVTGAGVDIAAELDELILLLSALADPDDPVLTCAALVGLFFGLDHEQLAAHRLECTAASDPGESAPDEASHRRGSFDFRHFRKLASEPSPVEKALHLMNSWWRLARSAPADVAVAAVVQDIGLLPYLAAGGAGESKAGALNYVLNVVRSAGVNGDSSLRAALEALDEALRSEEAEAPLQPGRDNVVRVMNLHKAKGLEAKVVVLAHPAGLPSHDPDLFIDRQGDGLATGYLAIEYPTGPRSTIRLAAPAGWDDLAAREAPYKEAEYQRLLYVAATRAREELVISYCAAAEKKGVSPWLPFYPYRDDLCSLIELQREEPPDRRVLEVPAGEIASQIDGLRAERLERATPSYEIAAVTKLVKHDASIFAVDQGGLGRSWGNAVHQAMEAVGRGTSDGQLRTVCRTALLENDLPIGADGEPDDLEDLVHLVERVLQSETWQRAVAADKLLSEVPFAAAELAADGTPRVVEGVVDLAFREPDGWVIVDYKTDVVEDPENLEARRSQYRSQVDEYARLWNELTGETVKERQILWVGMDLSAETW